MAAPKGLMIAMGAPKDDPADDDEPEDGAEGEGGDDAARDVWDAIQAKDEDAFCRALAAAIKASR